MLYCPFRSPASASEISRVVDFFRKLNDSNLLTEARGYSNLYDVSIVRWAQKRASLTYHNAVTLACTAKELEVPSAGRKSDQFVPSMKEEALLKCLTLEI